MLDIVLKLVTTGTIFVLEIPGRQEHVLPIVGSLVQ